MSTTRGANALGAGVLPAMRRSYRSGPPVRGFDYAPYSSRETDTMKPKTETHRMIRRLEAERERRAIRRRTREDWWPILAICLFGIPASAYLLVLTATSF